MIVKFKGTDPVTGKFVMGKTKFANQVTLDAWHERRPWLEVTVQES